MLAFALGVSLATAVLFGMAPAFTGSRIPSAEALKEGGRSAGAGVARQRLRRTLVIAEVGLSLVLVFVAALLGQTVVRLERQDPGFPADHLLLAHVFVPPARYADADAITAFCDVFAEKVRVIPECETPVWPRAIRRRSPGSRRSPYRVRPSRGRRTFRSLASRPWIGSSFEPSASSS